MVAGEDGLAQVGRVGPELPFMHAGIAAKGEAAGRDLGAAPSAGEALSRDPSTGLDAAGALTRRS